MTNTAPLRCFDDRCQVRMECILYRGRHNPPYGPVAMTWRVGWECLDELCHQATQAMDKFKSEAR